MATNTNAQYVNTLFGNIVIKPVANKKSEKSPAYTGFVAIPADELEALIEQLRQLEVKTDRKDNEVVYLSASLWERVDQDTDEVYGLGGELQMSTKLDTAEEEEKPAAKRAPARPRRRAAAKAKA